MGSAPVRSVDTSVQRASSGPGRRAGRDDPLALQRLSSALGNRGFRQLVDAHPEAASQGAAALARAVRSGREGKGLNPDALDIEDIEGHELGALRRLQRMTITQISPDSELRNSKCGSRNVQWIFSLDKPAPEDGYIVQHVEGTEDYAACPGPPGAVRKTHDFWEAWFVKKGDLVDWTTTRDGWTDGSKRGPRANKVGFQSSDGTVKFFEKSKTGDLGDFNRAPADASSPWGPGKVPTSGALPSTAAKPSWWDDASVEKTAVRQARSEWNCCDADPSKHTSRVTAYPPRPSRCEVKDWF